MTGSDDVTAPDGIYAPEWVYKAPQRKTVTLGIPAAGLDLAKNVFQVNRPDIMDQAVLRKKFRRVQV